MRRLPPLNSLRAFEAAARHLSFRRAADELGVTPTAISHQIKLLEEMLDQLLFVRRPRPLRLTPAGERFFPVLRDGFDAFAAAAVAIGGRDRGRPLVVTTTNAFAAHWLLPRLGEWQAQHPESRLEIRSGETIVDLHSGEVDFAVRYTRRPPSGVTALQLFDDRFLPVLSPALRARVGQLDRPDDIARAPLIAFEWKSGDKDAPSWERWIEASLPSRREAQALIARCEWIRVSEEAQAVDLALAGQGIALSSDVLIRRELADGRLEAPFPQSLPGYSFWVAYLPAHPRWAEIEDFVDWAREAG